MLKDEHVLIADKSAYRGYLMRIWCARGDRVWTLRRRRGT